MRKEKQMIDVDIKEFKKDLRHAIVEKYGSIGAFLNSDEARDKGFKYSDRFYLYDSCAISMAKLNKVAVFMGFNPLKRDTKIEKSVRYYTEE